MGGHVSGCGVGWEQIGEPSCDFTGDLPETSTAGLTGELVVELEGDLGGEKGSFTEAAVGEATGEGLMTGEELLKVDDVVRSNFTSSKTKGLGEKQVSGDFILESKDLSMN